MLRFLCYILMVSVLLFADIKSVKIHKGWNLMGLPFGELTTENIEKEGIISLWAYKNGKWSAWYADKSLLEQLKEKNIDILKYLDNHNGFWLLSSKDMTLEFFQEFANDSELQYTKDWNLLTINSSNPISISKFDDPSVSIIWKWKNGYWKAWSPKKDIIKLIKENDIRVIEYLYPYEGFWLKAKNDDSVPISQTTFELLNVPKNISIYDPISIKFSLPLSDVSMHYKKNCFNRYKK